MPVCQGWAWPGARAELDYLGWEETAWCKWKYSKCLTFGAIYLGQHDCFCPLSPWRHIVIHLHVSLCKPDCTCMKVRILKCITPLAHVWIRRGCGGQLHIVRCWKVPDWIRLPWHLAASPSFLDHCFTPAWCMMREHEAHRRSLMVFFCSFTLEKIFLPSVSKYLARCIPRSCF